MSRERKGSIVERDRKIYARVQFIGIDGRKRDVWRKADNRKHARELIKRLLREIDEHGEKPIDAAKMSFADLCMYYKQRYCKPASYVDGRKVDGLRDWKHVRGFLNIFQSFFGKKLLREVKYSDIQAFRSTRLQTETQYKRQRSITTVNRELACLRRLFNIAVRESWIIKNPFSCGDSLLCQAAERKRERILTKEEETRLLLACGNPQRRHIHPIIICALDTGMRQGEIFKLRWEDVNFDNRFIFIQAYNTKTMRERTVAITIRLYEALSELYNQQKPQPHNLVFGIESNIRKSFDNARREAGLLDVRFHDLRHTHATRLDDLGFSLAKIANQLGHTQFQTTLRYVNRDKEAVKQVASALDLFNAELPTQQEPSEMVN